MASKFVIVSSVAEGSDRIVAVAGLAAGFALEAVLPFARAEYARDFQTPESQKQYEELLGRAAAVFELDGGADDRARAYEAAGFVMLANIDLLVAIWDGKEAAGVGGTAQIVSRAIADGIPVVWIEPANPNAMKLAWPAAGEIPPANARPEEAFRSADPAVLAKAVAEIIAPPKQQEAHNSLTRYLREKERRWNFCPWYPLLLWLYRVRKLNFSDFRLPAALANAQNEWKKYLTILPGERAQRPAIEKILLPAYAAADRSAIYYSHLYRSGYVFNFLFASLAVALALGGIFAHNAGAKSVLVAVELAVIAAILITWTHGRRRQVHRRWLEYRRLAESLRHLRIFAPLGTAGSADRPQRNLDAADEDWVNWYAWSLRRLLPLPDRAVDRGYLSALRDAVREVEIAGQIAYHTSNSERMSRLDRRIHRSGEVLFGATAGLCVLFLFLAWLGAFKEIDPFAKDIILSVFTFFTALLPTLGAALGAINVQGDFRTVAEQSQRTKRRLSAIDDMLAAE
ncbi:MAG: hypothetical protein ACREH9_04270, partial [Pseudomonadota bacterium]